jgi:hypothetical protein
VRPRVLFCKTLFSEVEPQAMEINELARRNPDGLVTPQLRLAAAHRLATKSLRGRRKVELRKLEAVLTKHNDAMATVEAKMRGLVATWQATPHPHVLKDWLSTELEKLVEMLRKTVAEARAEKEAARRRRTHSSSIAEEGGGGRPRDTPMHCHFEPAARATMPGIST